MTEYSKDDYKEAFRLACHSLIMANHLIYGGPIIKEVKDEEIIFTDEYYKELKETQEMLLEEAKV